MPKQKQVRRKVKSVRMALRIKITGDEQGDLDFALSEVTRLVSEGYTRGGNCNDTGSYTFSVANVD